jgi:hypothetical protein
MSHAKSQQKLLKSFLHSGCNRAPALASAAHQRRCTSRNLTAPQWYVG